MGKLFACISKKVAKTLHRIIFIRTFASGNYRLFLGKTKHK